MEVAEEAIVAFQDAFDLIYQIRRPFEPGGSLEKWRKESGFEPFVNHTHNDYYATKHDRLLEAFTKLERLRKARVLLKHFVGLDAATCVDEFEACWFELGATLQALFQIEPGQLEREETKAWKKIATSISNPDDFSIRVSSIQQRLDALCGREISMRAAFFPRLFKRRTN